MRHIHNVPELKEHRKELRNLVTPAEQILWYELRSSKLGYKFRRQHSIGGYILDFYCPEKLVGIELDGDYHNESEQKEYDKERDKYLESMGMEILRFENEEIISDIKQVLIKIQILLEERQAKYYSDRIT